MQTLIWVVTTCEFWWHGGCRRVIPVHRENPLWLGLKGEVQVQWIFGLVLYSAEPLLEKVTMAFDSGRDLDWCHSESSILLWPSDRGGLFSKLLLKGKDFSRSSPYSGFRHCHLQENQSLERSHGKTNPKFWWSRTTCDPLLPHWWTCGLWSLFPFSHESTGYSGCLVPPSAKISYILSTHLQIHLHIHISIWLFFIEVHVYDMFDFAPACCPFWLFCCCLLFVSTLVSSHAEK